MRAPHLLMAMIFAIGGGGCNQLFGLDAPARDGDAGGGDDDDGDGDGGGGDAGDAAANPDDVDGDGIANGVDNCPTTFNPSQGDEDADAEINGGDACDPCPHRAAPVPGSPHVDLDMDGVGDDCDPSTSIKHCWRWFDGFSDAPDVVLARYELTNGTWNAGAGELAQSDAFINLAEATVRDRVYDRPVVATMGVPSSIPDANNDAGVSPPQNAVGVTVGRIDTGPGTCFGIVMRRPSSPTQAQVALMRETQLSEVILVESVAPNSRLVAGERVLATADLLSTPSSPRVVGMLPDDYPMETVATVATTCSTLGRAGARTQYAGFAFRYLYVIEVEGASGCGPREP